MNFLRLAELDLAGKRVFIRADFNVPFNADGTLSDDTRIRATLPAICHCLEAGAAVMIISHLGRPTEGALTAADSLAPVAATLSALLGRPVPLIRDWTDGGFTMRPGEVVLLENCRGNVGEKADDPALAARIARFIDVYVNDAFGTAHRKECTLHALALKRGSRLKLLMEEQHVELPSDEETRRMSEIAMSYVRKTGMHPYYLYRQGYMSGDLENVGCCRAGAEGMYNIQIMEEHQTIIGIGGAATTKVVDFRRKRMKSSFNAKDLVTYLRDIDIYIEKRRELLDEAYGNPS